jgi:hypothetical protein
MPTADDLLQKQQKQQKQREVRCADPLALCG